MAAGVGPAEDVEELGPAPVVDAAGGVAPPKANDPAATWPSTAETVRQATV
jgi:hypothetical protein